MLCLPKRNEERHLAYKMQQLGAAQVKDEDDTLQDLARKIEMLFAEDSSERQVAEWIMREMRYKEQYG